MGWTFVTDDEARAHPLYGFGGWLLVVYGVEILLLAYTLFNIASIAMKAGAETLLMPGFAVVWAHVALALPFLVMAPLKARAMPLVAILCCWVGAAWSLSSYLAVPSLLGNAAIIFPAVLSLAWRVVFTVYLLRSRRVNVTYRGRVRQDAAVPQPAQAG